VRALHRNHLCIVALACAIGACAAPMLAAGAPSAQVTQQAAAAKARLDAMEKDLGATMGEYTAAASQLAVTRSQIAANRSALKTLNTSLKSGDRRLDAEAVFLYRTNGNGYTEALLSAGTLDQFASRLFSLARVASRDAELLRQMRADRAAAVRVAAQLALREQRQATLVADVSGRRASAQAAIDAQQRYADKLSAKVSAALQAAQSAATSPSTPGPAVTPVQTGSHGVVRATVDGLPGTYAVLAGDPRSYRSTGISFDGEATWYGNSRPGMHTSSGRAFDEREFTCAHKTLPFGTRIAVTFRGSRVIVVVTDRGPYGAGRVIDLSKHAASVLGLVGVGVGQVHCEVVSPK
jgi:rare lipoprotein A (peptidoglycan hydrolase)